MGLILISGEFQKVIPENGRTPVSLLYERMYMKELSLNVSGFGLLLLLPVYNSVMRPMTFLGYPSLSFFKRLRSSLAASIFLDIWLQFCWMLMLIHVGAFYVYCPIKSSCTGVMGNPFFCWLCCRSSLGSSSEFWPFASFCVQQV